MPALNKFRFFSTSFSRSSKYCFSFFSFTSSPIFYKYYEDKDYTCFDPEYYERLEDSLLDDHMERRGSCYGDSKSNSLYYITPLEIPNKYPFNPINLISKNSKYKRRINSKTGLLVVQRIDY